MKFVAYDSHKNVEQLYDYHYEKVIDKAYNQRIKVKPVNPVITVLLSLIPWIIAFGYWLIGDDANFFMMVLFDYFIFFSNMMLGSAIKEAKANKRAPYAFSMITTFIMYAVTMVLGVVYFGVDAFKELPLPIIIGIIAGIVIIPFVTYIVVCLIKTSKEEKEACTLCIWAMCIGYEQQVVGRYAADNAFSRIERNRSVAYDESDTVMVYTPVFQHMWNGVAVNSKPNMCVNRQNYVVGNMYQIYVNPNNPSEMRLG